jgi:hypothetical protein
MTGDLIKQEDDNYSLVLLKRQPADRNPAAVMYIQTPPIANWLQNISPLYSSFPQSSATPSDHALSWMWG